MDQLKIGKFLKELRVENKMTQQDVADKLGISDKAISKWENGKCLMDIVFLKQLSELYNVSIVEILNGERIEKESIYEKSSKVVNATLIYSKEEIKKARIITIISMVVLLLLIFFCYKGYNLYKYSTSEYVGKELLNPVDLNKEYKIYKKSIPEDEYFEIKNVKIKNIVSNMELDYETYLDGKIVHVRYKDKNNENYFGFTKHIEYLDVYKYENISSDRFGNRIYADFNSFLLEKDINDDVDMLKYFNKNGYMHNDLFTSIEDMKINLHYNKLVSIMDSIEADYKCLIGGDYKGVLIENKRKKIITVWLSKNDMHYCFSFGGDYANLNFVLDTISTIEIK